MRTSPLIYLGLALWLVGAAAAQNSCQLTVGEVTTTFSNCATAPKEELMLYWTLESAGVAGKTLFKGGMRAVTSGWAAFGFSPVGKMVGSSTIILADTQANGPTVEGYYLNSTMSTDINANKGAFELKNAAAGKDGDGALVAFFAVELDKSISELETVPSTYIYVLNGRLGEDDLLVGHNGGEYSAAQMTFKGSEGTTSAPLPSLEGCELEVAGKSYSFDACEPLATPDVVLYYTLEASKSGTLFKAGLRAVSKGWAGFGVSKDGKMVGSDAVIIADTLEFGPVVGGYKLPGYFANEVNDANGTLKLENAAASKAADGALVAVMQFQLDKPPSELTNNPINYIYATNGRIALGDFLSGHSDAESKFGTSTMALRSSLVPAAGSSTSDTAVEVNATPCSIAIGGTTTSYRACYDVGFGRDSNFRVYWSLDDDPQNPGSDILSMALSTTYDGWVSVGFAEEAGEMEGGAVILQTCSACPPGASILEYYLSGTERSDVEPDNGHGMTDLVASRDANGLMVGRFEMKMKGMVARRRRSLLADGEEDNGDHENEDGGDSEVFSLTAFPLIYAIGGVNSAGSLIPHTAATYADGYLDLTEGRAGAAGGEIQPQISFGGAVTTAHMWLATIGWGVLVPVAILQARYFKERLAKNALWFQLHRGLAAFGFFLAVIGFGLGFSANLGFWETEHPVHRDLGTSATILGFLQMASLFKFVRRCKGDKYRAAWFFVHSWVGRAAAMCAIANIYYGIINVAVLGAWAWAVYSAILAVVVGIAVFMEVVNYREKKQVLPQKSVDMALEMHAPSSPTQAMYEESHDGESDAAEEIEGRSIFAAKKSAEV